MAAAASKRRTTATDGSIAALPEELLLEVFSRVGNIKDLFLFAVTSRRWLRLFTDPAFLRGLSPGNGQGHRARLLGFIFQPTRFVRCDKMAKLRRTQHASVSAPAFLPTPGSPLGRADRALTSFVADDGGTFNYAEPLGARRGIVLMQLVPRIIDLDVEVTHRHLHLGLCNPTTGERHVPPPTCFGLYKIYGYAIVTAADDSDLDGNQRRPSSSSSAGRFNFSQLLLLVTPREGSERYIQSYSAATRSWSALTAMFQNTRRSFDLVGEQSAAVHQGAAHWLCVDRQAAAAAAARSSRDDHYLCKLSAELGTSRVSQSKLPVRAGGRPLLWVTGDGKLSIACVYPQHVTVWTQPDGDDDASAAWVRTHVIRMPMTILNMNDPQQLKRGEAWFEFNRGSKLVLYRCGGVFVLDLEKEAMEKVMDCTTRLFSDDPYRHYVPYEMDLVEFFASQLGGLCRG